MNRTGKGKMTALGVVGIVALVLIAGVLVAGFLGFSLKDKVASIGSSSNADAEPGTNVESLAVFQTNGETKATEGSNDLEFWDKDADITNTSLSARETLTLSSGAVTDTSVPALRSNDNQGTKDLYVEGGSAYYDDLVPTWSILYNVQTGKGTLQGNGPSDSVIAIDFGTFSDLDAGVDAVDTGLADNADGTLNYSNSTGDGTVYFRVVLGNDESDSTLRDAVFCVGDSDGDLEGNELTALTISKYSGDSIGNFPSNILPLFTQSAGTGAYACTPIGDIVGLKTGTYQIAMTIAEVNFATGEDFEFGMDDLGGWKARSYPSQNLKATAEDVQVVGVA